MSPQLLGEEGWWASVVDPAKVADLDVSYWFVRPDMEDLTTLSSLVDEEHAGEAVPARLENLGADTRGTFRSRCRGRDRR